MDVTKYTHACVRITDGARALVIDPGVWSTDVPMDGVSAILVTHEHADHVDAGRLAGLGVPVFAPAGAEIPGVDFTPVRSGEAFDAGGFTVRAYGGSHALISDGLPACANLGYLVGNDLYHPGDSYAVPGAAVRTLLVPAQASWMKLGESIEFARAIGAERAFQIHDGQLNGRGLESVNGWFEESFTGYRYLAPGESLSS